MLLQALRKPKKGLGVARRKEVDDCVFRLRDGKQAARALAHLVPWDQAHTFDVGPRAAGTRDWLLRAFRQFAEGETETTPPDQTLIRFVWGRLRGASSLSVADYCGRLLKALAAEGETGYRTRRVLAVKRALTRFGTLLRPSQAPPVDVDAVMDVVEAFGREGAERERAFVALVWMARARMADARYLLVRDLVEVTDEGATGLEVALKEKQQKSWTPVVYLPPGTLTLYVVEWARARRLAEGQDAPLFAATETQYQRLMRRVVGALPAGSWAHSLRRGSAQALQSWGMSVDGLRDALRHASSRTTVRYLMRTAPEARRKARSTLDVLQERPL